MQIDNDNASNRLFLAEVYNANKQYNETIKLLDAELNNLKTAQGFLLLAGAYFNLGQNDKALETIEFSLRKLKYNLALIKQFAELENSLEKNNETLILQVYADPEASLSDALFLHFYYAIKQQQDKAINVLLKLNTAQKDNILYWYTLAEAYLASGDNRAASSAANNLISTQAPTFSHFQSILSTFNKIGDVASTIKFIENNLSTFPGNDELSLYLADLYSKNGRAIEATKILDNISKQSETLAVAKAVNAVNLGKLNDAKALFESSMLEYGGVKTVIPYTNFLRNMANTEQAIRILNRFLEKQPDSTIVKNHLATMSGPEESMSIYRDILAGDPNNVIALNNLAWQLYLKGDYQAGFAFAEQAYAIMPEHKDVQNTYNKLKEKL